MRTEEKLTNTIRIRASSKGAEKSPNCLIPCNHLGLLNVPAKCTIICSNGLPSKLQYKKTQDIHYPYKIKYTIVSLVSALLSMIYRYNAKIRRLPKHVHAHSKSHTPKILNFDL